jgi:hypothetical protein
LLGIIPMREPFAQAALPGELNNFRAHAVSPGEVV